MSSALATRENSLGLAIDPFLAPVAMVTTQDIVLRQYFRERIVLGQENLPMQGPVLLAPTHRSRWDALMLPMAAGRRVTGRDCRFMVTVDEMKGLQGWFLHRLGCFPVNQSKPSLTSLRYAIDLMADGQQVVVFPEGTINRTEKPIKLYQGLARLAQLAKSQNIDVQVVPVGLGYSEAIPKACGRASICFAEPMKVLETGREAVKSFNAELSEKMHAAEQAALHAVGRHKKAP